jgi:hypothetical protein
VRSGEVGDRYRQPSLADRRAIVEILGATTPGLPAYSRAATLKTE